jgi:hypothetical protein
MVRIRQVSDRDIALGPSAGNIAAVMTAAEGFKCAEPENTLRAIDQRIRAFREGDLHYSSPDRGLRTTSEMLERNVIWGCSAAAQIACHLSRACGIPSILVKSIEEGWINFRNKGNGEADGHVYVEVLVNGGPCLWDPGSGLVVGYRPGDSSVQSRKGPRRICDTGDPDEVVLSHHGRQWEEEIKRLFPLRQGGR